jgi:serine/threonine protein kinase
VLWFFSDRRVGIAVKKKSKTQGAYSSWTSGNSDKVTVAGEEYTTLRLLGKGGFSSVYEVYGRSRECYALKVVDFNEAK